MINFKEAVVYWIHLKDQTDIHTEGYIGVSQNLIDLVAQHKKEITENKHKNIHLMNAIKKYGWDNLIIDTVLCGVEEFCYQIENHLRPERNMGWNLSSGGHRGPGWPKGKKRPKEWLEEQEKKRLPAKLEKIAKKAERKKEKEESRNQRLLEKEQRKKLASIKKEKSKILKAERDIRRTEAKKIREEKRLLSGFYDIAPGERPICKVCNKNVRAPAYYRNGKRYFRSRCTACISRDRNIKIPEPRWKINGYKKKATCDLCGFRSSYPSQIVVYHIDGDLNNCSLINLRSICLCCVEVIKRKHLSWRIGDITPDT